MSKPAPVNASSPVPASATGDTAAWVSVNGKVAWVACDGCAATVVWATAAPDAAVVGARVLEPVGFSWINVGVVIGARVVAPTVVGAAVTPATVGPTNVVVVAATGAVVPMGIVDVDAGVTWNVIWKRFVFMVGTLGTGCTCHRFHSDHPHRALTGLTWDKRRRGVLHHTFGNVSGHAKSDWPRSA